MFKEIPQYGLRAYALFFSKYGSKEQFGQNELDWIVGESMKKKIFSVLLNSGWIKKVSRCDYKCVSPKDVIKGLVDFKVPEIMKGCRMDYAFTGMSAVEIWSDYSYIQRGIEKSPYFIKVLKKDLKSWKKFFNVRDIPNYVNKGSTIGEYVILVPVEHLKFAEEKGLKVDKLKDVMKFAKQNNIYEYAYNYMRSKYGTIAS